MSRRVTAVVQVELKVVVHVGNWDAKTNFMDLEEQAQREARNALAGLCKNTSVRIVGEPGVMTVTVKETN